MTRSRYGFIFVISLVALILSLIAGGRSGSALDRDHFARARAFGFGLEAAGTYSGEVVVAGGPVFATLNTLGADGTFVTETAVDFGAGGSGPFAFRSGGRGNWRRVASSGAVTTYLHFNYNDAGTLTAIEKINASLVFDVDFSAAEGEGTFAVYSPDQDPFGDEPPLIFSGTASVSMQRVPIER